MPYIKPERRPDLDPLLQAVWDTIMKPTAVESESGQKIPKTLDEIKGDLNYCMTKFLVTALARFGTRYHTLSNIKAIPKDVLDEFCDQFMKPYEKKKREENGKVEPLKVRL